jgi:CheY-like chemotaxis protein
MTEKKLRCEGVVVVVDDEEDTRELLRELLELRGYQVTTAQDGSEALDVLRSGTRVCFVILDLAMPVMDGHAVMKVLSTDAHLSGLRVCISTSAPDRAPAGLPCLPKPIDIDRLFAMVDENCAAEACHA